MKFRLSTLTVKISHKKKIGMQAMNNFKTINRFWCCSQCLYITHYHVSNHCLESATDMRTCCTMKSRQFFLPVQLFVHQIPSQILEHLEEWFLGRYLPSKEKEQNDIRVNYTKYSRILLNIVLIVICNIKVFQLTATASRLQFRQCQWLRWNHRQFT